MIRPFLPDGTPPDPGDGECPECARMRVRHDTLDYFEEVCDAEQPGSWRRYLYASAALKDAADELSYHAQHNATGPLCREHDVAGQESDRELQHDCERDQRA